MGNFISNIFTDTISKLLAVPLKKLNFSTRDEFFKISLFYDFLRPDELIRLE